MVVNDTDEALMMRYRGGDARAFEALYTRHKGGLFRYFQRQCGNGAVAEELFQDVWMKLINARDRYEPRAKFTTYLYHMAHNRLIDYYRKQSTGIPVSFGEAGCPGLDETITETQQTPERQAASREQTEHLFVLIAKLPEAQREVFLMREESGMSLEQIAEATRVGKETAKSRLRYAVAALRRGMECYS